MSTDGSESTISTYTPLKQLIKSQKENLEIITSTPVSRSMFNGAAQSTCVSNPHLTTIQNENITSTSPNITERVEQLPPGYSQIIRELTKTIDETVTKRFHELTMQQLMIAAQSETLPTNTQTIGSMAQDNVHNVIAFQSFASDLREINISTIQHLENKIDESVRQNEDETFLGTKTTKDERDTNISISFSSDEATVIEPTQTTVIELPNTMKNNGVKVNMLDDQNTMKRDIVQNVTASNCKTSLVKSGSEIDISMIEPHIDESVSEKDNITLWRIEKSIDASNTNISISTGEDKKNKRVKRKATKRVKRMVIKRVKPTIIERTRTTKPNDEGMNVSSESCRQISLQGETEHISKMVPKSRQPQDINYANPEQISSNMVAMSPKEFTTKRCYVLLHRLGDWNNENMEIRNNEQLSRSRLLLQEFDTIKRCYIPLTRVSETVLSSQHPHDNPGTIITTIEQDVEKIVETASKVDAKSEHRANILRVLNKGDLKELQSLPRIGLKTATEIKTFRSLNGEYTSIESLEKLSAFRGKGFERFVESNYL